MILLVLGVVVAGFVAAQIDRHFYYWNPYQGRYTRRRPRRRH